MAITIDNAQSYNTGFDASPVQVSYTVSAALKKLVLVVAVRLQTASGALSAVSATYGGEAMTLGYGVADANGSYFALFYKFAPLTGANTLSVVYTTGDASAAALISAFTLVGVKQSSGLRDSKTASGGAAGGVTLAAMSNVKPSDMCIMAVGQRNASGDNNFTWGAGQTEIHDLYVDVSGFYANLGTSYELGESTLSSTFSVASSSYGAWGGAFIQDAGGGFWFFFDCIVVLGAWMTNIIQTIALSFKRQLQWLHI